MKKVLSFIINHPFSLIVPGIVLFCLDVKPFGALLMIVGGVLYLIKYFNNKNNGSGSSSGRPISTTEAAYLVYGYS